MRYEKGRKEETHRHIVKVASERFRKDGVDGVGISTLMADAGLTVGGFYSHFSSKEDLVCEAVLYALSKWSALPGDGPALDGPTKLGRFIDAYLSRSHRDALASGCAFAALGSDLARRPRGSRNSFSKALTALIDQITAALPPTVPDGDRRARAQSVYSQLLGTLQLSRLLTDKAAADAMLAEGRIEARRLAGLDANGDATSTRARGAAGRKQGADVANGTGRPRRDADGTMATSD